MTAAELMSKLEADPQYLAMRAAKDAERAGKKEQFRLEQSQLLRELQSLGWQVNSVWDLVNTSKPYPDLISVLLNHLNKPYSDRTREGIARSLAVPEAAGEWESLRAEYQASPRDSGVKKGLAVALAVICNDEDIHELAELVKDTSSGASRLYLLSGLRKSQTALARQTLEELSNDPVFSKEIASWQQRT